MNVRGSLATLSLVAGAMGGCAAHAGEDEPPEEAPAEDQALEVSVDSLDIVHGALRITATMVDGAAGVSVRLGGDCEHREVGGGLSTLSTLVWSLGDSEVADALGCGLVVRARVRDGTHYVNKLAELGLMVDIAAQEGNADDGPQLQTVATSEFGVCLVFAPVTRRARLTTADSILLAMPPESDEEDRAPDDNTGRFTVPRIDFARSVLRQRPLYLDGSSFATSLSLSGTVLQGEPQASDTPQDEAEETAPEEVNEQAPDETNEPEEVPAESP
jgi:hypothetical protein